MIAPLAEPICITTPTLKSTFEDMCFKKERERKRERERERERVRETITSFKYDDTHRNDPEQNNQFDTDR